MNWFERYGIVGMFFVSMAAIWLFCLFPDARALFNENHKILLDNIVWLCGLSFLPFGYIIMAISQLWYYKIRSKSRIHCEYWKDLPEENKNKILEAEKDGKLVKFIENEEQLEAVLTYYDRYRKENIENNKFLSIFASKRYDVIAINRGMMWAIIFSFLAALSIEAIILDIKIRWDAFSTWIVFVVALLIILLLFFSMITLENQIFEIGRRKLRNIKIQKKYAQSKRKSPQKLL